MKPAHLLCEFVGVGVSRLLVVCVIASTVLWKHEVVTHFQSTSDSHDFGFELWTVQKSFNCL